MFNKTGSNAFVTTNLHYVLGNIGVRRLVCVGVLTDECVAGTVKVTYNHQPPICACNLRERREREREREGAILAMTRKIMRVKVRVRCYPSDDHKDHEG